MGIEMQKLSSDQKAHHRGEVDFIEVDGALSESLKNYLAENPSPEALDVFLSGSVRFKRKNMIFNFPRIQYSALDRGETPETVNAQYFTLSNTILTNPSLLIVPDEVLRLEPSTRAIDPSNPNNTLIRFILDVGQFVGSWKTAVLIGGAAATLTPQTGKIVAAVNDVRDDSNAPLNRDGTTIHLVNWKIKHLDSSEV